MGLQPDEAAFGQPYVGPMDSDNRSLMDRTGLGLLPGIILAFFVTMFAMAALLLETAWAVVLLLVLIGIVVAALVIVVLALAGEDEDDGRLRSKIPGLATWPDDREAR